MIGTVRVNHDLLNVISLCCIHLIFIPGERYWIGLTDEEVEGLWKWAGTDERMTFTDWNHGEPNSWDELEDCVGIAKDDQGRWFDIGCDSMYLPICETR